MLVICAALAFAVVVEEHPRAKAAHCRKIALERLHSRGGRSWQLSVACEGPASSRQEPRMTEKKTVGVLADFGADDLSLAGGKGANLGELMRQGFPVPTGFVVTTAAYAALLAESGLGARLDSLLVTSNDGDHASGAQIRDLFTQAEIPDAVRSEIVAAYATMGGGPVAVRSSATAEDLPGAAFAGQQDTYLNVVGEEALLQAVLDCWASLWTDRAISYRQRQGIDQRQVAIAVVVQEMVQAETAGVLFSANPVTGERGEIVIDASPGLGEAVVSGLVTPEHYVLDGTGKVRAYTPAATS
ncbi:PEP/pyruvate-binding domain-containing protein [Arthrobacter sp. SA17]